MASSALAALAGILFALALNDISPYIGRDQVELRGLAVIVLGGMGSIPGTFIGGFTLGLLESHHHPHAGHRRPGGRASWPCS